MMPTSAVRPVEAQARRRAALRRWMSRVGALMALLLGVVHLAVNTIGFLGLPTAERAAGDYLLFAVAPSAVAWAIAFSGWWYGRAPADRRALAWRIAAGIGAAALLFLAVGFAAHPVDLVVPVGPGPWSAIGGPALMIAVLIPRGTRGQDGRGGSVLR